MAGGGPGGDDVGQRLTTEGHPDQLAPSHGSQRLGQRLLKFTYTDLPHVVTLPHMRPPVSRPGATLCRAGWGSAYDAGPLARRSLVPIPGMRGADVLLAAEECWKLLSPTVATSWDVPLVTSPRKSRCEKGP